MPHMACMAYLGGCCAHGLHAILPIRNGEMFVSQASLPLDSCGAMASNTSVLKLIGIRMSSRRTATSAGTRQRR